MSRSDVLADLEGEYRKYLLEVRALRMGSLPRRLKSFRLFAAYLAERRIQSPRRVSLNLMYKFLECRARNRSRRTAKSLHEDVVSVVKFLHFSGRLPEDLSKHMRAPCTWNLADIPKAFSEEEASRMLSALKSETAYDYRERLVMLLFICYGLRLGEVTNLNLNDIDLREKAITIRERKNGQPLVLPLLPALEEAYKGYLEHFRPPDVKTKRLFVTIKRRSRAPLKFQATHQIIKKFLKGVGLKGCATMFRHTLATHLINSGVRLESIQAVLGHRQSDSTRVYAKVHWEALREIAENDSLML